MADFFYVVQIGKSLMAENGKTTLAIINWGFALPKSFLRENLLFHIGNGFFVKEIVSTQLDVDLGGCFTKLVISDKWQLLL